MLLDMLFTSFVQFCVLYVFIRSTSNTPTVRKSINFSKNSDFNRSL